MFNSVGCNITVVEKVIMADEMFWSESLKRKKYGDEHKLRYNHWLIIKYIFSFSQLAIIQLSIALCFAVCVYNAEHFQKDRDPLMFRNIGDALWYALITMYTVGYGDQVPITVLGRFLGCCCAILGLLDMGGIHQ